MLIYKSGFVWIIIYCLLQGWSCVFDNGKSCNMWTEDWSYSCFWAMITALFWKFPCNRRHSLFIIPIKIEHSYADIISTFSVTFWMLLCINVEQKKNHGIKFKLWYIFLKKYVALIVNVGRVLTSYNLSVGPNRIVCFWAMSHVQCETLFLLSYKSSWIKKAVNE